MQENVPKGKLTHIKKIHALQKFFEIVYDPIDLSRTVAKAANVLTEKFTKKLPRLKILTSVKPEQRYDLAF